MANDPTLPASGSLTKRISAVALTQATLAAGAVGTDMILAWNLDKPANGLFQAALLVARIALIAGTLGIPTSLYLLYPRTAEHHRRGLFHRSMFILATAGFLIAAIFWLGAPLIARGLGQPASSIVLIRAAIWLILTGLPALLAEPVLILQGRAWWAAGNAAFSGLFQCAAVYWLIKSGHGPAGVFYALALGSGLRLILPLIIASRNSPAQENAAEGPLQISWREHLLVVALPIGITAAIDGLSAYGDRAVVARYFSSENLALYRYSAQEVPFIGLLIGALTPVLLPRFSELLAEGKSSEVLKIWHRATLRTAPVLYGIFAALIWLAPELLSVLYSPAYREGAGIFRIYLLMLPLRVITYMPMLYALNRGRFVALVAAGEVVLSITLACILALPLNLGLKGAALGAVLATLIQAVIYLGAIQYSLKISWKNILPWRGLITELTLALLFFLPLTVFRMSSWPAGMVLSLGIGWGVVYLAWRLRPARP